MMVTEELDKRGILLLSSFRPSDSINIQERHEQLIQSVNYFIVEDWQDVKSRVMWTANFDDDDSDKDR